MRLIDADALLHIWTKPDDFGTPDERWRPESEFSAIVNSTPTIAVVSKTRNFITINLNVEDVK